MRKSNQLVKLGLAVLMASMYSTSASADVIPGNAAATVIAPLLLVEVTAMDFGTLSGGTAAGTVVMTTASAMSSTGGASTLASAPGAAGAFTIQGAAAQAYTLTISGTATLTDGGVNSMTADTFTNNAVALTGGADAFQVGGTLNVGASQVAGAYSTANAGGATFTLTANYN